MSQFIDNAMAATNSPHVKSLLNFMEDYEETHTYEETGRMWVWIRDELKASLEVPNES